MKLEMSGQMRMEQRMKLAPHMIQSMEILQLPILALKERIEQELNSNPVLETDEPASSEENEPVELQSESETGERDSASAKDSEKIEDFEYFGNLDEDYKDYMSRGEYFSRRSTSDDKDKKLEAIKNTAAPSLSLHDYLTEQWQLAEADEAVKKAGSEIVDYIDKRGYLTVRLEQLHNKHEGDFTFEDLKKALELVQKLEPTGVGGRDLKECLLIQMAQSPEGMSFEARLVSEYMNELLENRLPSIAKKMDCSIETINHSIERLSKLNTSPGLTIGRELNHPITVDVIVEPLKNSGGFSVRLVDSTLPNLRINDYYTKMSKDAVANIETKKFLRENIRSAQWVIEAIAQRKNTLLRVTRAIVKYQHEFFEKGQLHLQPMPMSKVADEVGVHLATVSRAVADKYVQCPFGILPLRKFFSGGIEDANGQKHSWQAIRAKLQQIIDSEDKTKPLNDDQICKELVKAGIPHIARRTVVKYRMLLNIPTARLRKKY